MSKIGIFWVHRQTVIGRAIPVDEGHENVPGLIDSPDSHVRLWATVRPRELPGTAYEEVPRGRVIYDRNRKKSLVYLDKTLLNEAAKARISEFFELQSAPIQWKSDLHYTTNPHELDELFDD